MDEKKESDQSPPIISLSSDSVVREIAEACSTWGVFILTDHGISDKLQNQVLKLGYAFFNLPLYTKLKYNLQDHGAKWRGYMPLGGERSVKGKIRDFKDGLYMGDEHKVDDPHMGLPTFGSNIFPDEEIPEMRAVFTYYHVKTKELGNRLMSLLSLGLELPEDCINSRVSRGEPVILPRMFRYPPQSEGQSPQYGIGEHSDYGLWTIILFDAPGLEFRHAVHNTWHAVPFVLNAIIMNVGDVLDRLTAGRFVSAYHRAINCSTTKYRMSLPFFYDPSWEARMETLPVKKNLGHDEYDTTERAQRWSRKITCSFDQKPGVEYSEFLAKKVAKVFPSLIPESTWKNLSSTSEPSTRHALVVDTPDTVYTAKVLEELKKFYENHEGIIKESHGLPHVMAVYDHACKAIACHQPTLSSSVAMEIKIAAFLHDADDSKYFPGSSTGVYPNASRIMETAQVPNESCQEILTMISLVSCSQNGNSVPDFVRDNNKFHLLIPRCSDRLEAVGAAGVIRCFQYNEEKGRPLSSAASPRAKTVEEVWEFATPERFVAYQRSGPTADDMISHYYDKLLHVARLPPELVQNTYLIQMAEDSSKELVEMCLRFGRTGVVDVGYIQELADEMKKERA